MPKVKKLSNELFVGIDPGKSGGIAALHSNGTCYQTWVMPDSERGLWDLLEIITKSNRCRAVIEKVHSSPQMGVASAFTFGFGYGQVRMAMLGNKMPFVETTPQSWQKYLEIPKRNTKKETQPQFKKRLQARAQQMFPHQSITLKTADSLLIAEYCRRIS